MEVDLTKKSKHDLVLKPAPVTSALQQACIQRIGGVSGSFACNRKAEATESKARPARMLTMAFFATDTLRCRKARC